jgi:uncharacterized phage-like protein YoqJ
MNAYPDLRGLTVAFTGHRPPKLGGYGEQTDAQLIALADMILRETQPSCVIQGMALGWDQAVAYAAIRRHMRVIAALPFAGQAVMWPEAAKARYERILERCSEVIIVSPGVYSAAKMQIRNQWMVDRGDYLIALHDGSSGGTGNCVEYAHKVHLPVLNVWREWQAIIAGRAV